jgi:hypothetical protein
MAQTAVYSAAQRQKAERLLETVDMWAEGERTSDGLRFNLFTSESATGVVYQTHINGLGCTCPGARKSARGRCFHQLATQMATERAAAEQPKRKSYSDLMDAFDANVDAF